MDNTKSIYNGFNSFHYLESGDVIFKEEKTIKSLKKLQSGTYSLGYDDHTEICKLETYNDYETYKEYNFQHKKEIDNLYNSFFQKKSKKQLIV